MPATSPSTAAPTTPPMPSQTPAATPQGQPKATPDAAKGQDGFDRPITRRLARPIPPKRDLVSIPGVLPEGVRRVAHKPPSAHDVGPDPAATAKAKATGQAEGGEEGAQPSRTGLEFKTEQERDAFLDKMSREVLDGHTFSTPEEAEAFYSNLITKYRSFRGTFKPVKALADKADLALSNLTKANTAATGWKSRATSFEGQVASLKAKVAEMEGLLRQHGVAVSTPESAPAAKQAEGGGDIDWAFFDDMRKKAGDTAAFAWLTGEQDRISQERYTALLDKRFDEITKPERERQELAQRTERIKGMMDSLVAEKYPNGDLQFPEFMSEKDAPGVVNIWLNYFEDVPPEFYMNRKSLVAAVSLYRTLGEHQKRLLNNPTATKAEVKEVLADSLPPSADVSPTVGDPSQGRPAGDALSRRNQAAAELRQRRGADYASLRIAR